MELYGSLLNISGSVSASAFTGSFIGDGSGLYNLPASGVTGLNLSQISTGSISASLSPDGFNVNTDTSITGSLIVSGDTQISGALTASGLIYPTTDALLEKQFITSDTNGNLSWDDVHTMYEHVQAGEPLVKTDPIYLSGSVGAIPIAYKSIASDPTTMPAVYVMDQNLNTGEEGRAIALGLIDGIDLTGLEAGDIAYVGSTGGWTTTRPTGTDLIQVLGVVTKGGSGGKGFVFNAGVSDLPNIATNKLWIGDTNSYPIEKTVGEIGLAITGSNLFIGDQTISGSVIPSVDNLYDLGSPTHQWRDVYISSGSLYVDGTKVISSTTQELTITTDTGQSIKILEAGSDSVVIQTADGDIELKSSGGGDVLLDPTNGLISIKGTTQIQDGFKITSSGGTDIVFGDSIIVSGSIQLTGTIDGVDIASFKTSLDSITGSNDDRLDSLETKTGSLSNDISTIDGRLDSIETESGSIRSAFNTYTSSNNTTNTTQNNRLTALESATSSLSGDISTIDGRVDSLETESGSIRSAFNTYTSSNNTTNTSQNNRLSALETESGSIRTDFNVITGSFDGRLDSLETESGSIRTTFNSYTSSNNTTNTTQNNRLSALETESGSIRDDFNEYTSSTDDRLDSLETTSGSHNTRIGDLENFETSVNAGLEFTGSNVTIKGDLLVKGTETRVNSTTVEISDNIISLNGSGAANAGIEVRDATSPGLLSGSLIWDGTNNYWKGGTKLSEERLLTVLDTGSLVNRLNSLETTTGSLDGRVDSLETFSSSADSRLDSIESVTGSYITGYTEIDTLDSVTDRGSTTTNSIDVGGLTSKNNSGPSQITFFRDENLTTNSTIGQINFQADYLGSPIIYGRIDVGSNASNVRTDIDFYVKSTSGTLENALKLQGGSAKPKAFFYNTVNAPSFVKDGGTSSEFLMADGSISTNPGWITGYTESDTLDSVTARGSTTTNSISVGEVTSSGIGQFAGAIRITETGTAQSILIGNQDSGGVDNPSIIMGVNGALRFGNGDSWLGEGGTFTEKAKLDGNGFTVGNTVTATSFVKTGGTSSEFLKADGSVDTSTYLTTFTETDPIYTSERDALQLNKTVHPTLLFSTLADYNKPSGYSTMIQPSSYQNPLPSHGFYHIIARRDTGGGYGALLQSYNSHEIYHGNTTVSTSDITWYKLWNSGDFTSTNISNWNTAYGWGDHASAGYLTSYSETDTLATVTSRGNTTTGDINVNGNILLTGTATTTNQGRLIDFTGFDKEGTTDFSDRAYIQHTVNTGGHAGSVLVISSQNDADDGIAFITNASSNLKHNSNTIWTAGNDGSGSGLDADTLDTYHASSFVLKNTSYEWTSGVLTFRSGDVLEVSTGDQATLEVYQDTAGADAFMQFHVSGDYAAYFGLKGDINDFAVGGWSMGNTYYRVWHAGNDGSGSGLDADTVDGLQASQFLRSDADDTTTGVITILNGSDPKLILQTSAGDSSDWNYINFVGRDTVRDAYIGTDADGDLNLYSDKNSVGISITATGTFLGSNRILTTADEGSGNGLDADLWDGNQFSSYLNQAVLTSSSPSFNAVAATNNADATGLSFRSSVEVISGEGWCTAHYAYNNNDGFLFLNRDAGGTAHPAFHIGGYNNAGYGPWSDADSMITLVRHDGTKSTGSTYADKGLSNSSYYSNIVKTTTGTVFRDSQGQHTFTSSVAGSTVLSVVGTSGQLFSIVDDLTGDIFNVSDATGVPILSVNAAGIVTVDDTLRVYGEVIAYASSDERLKENIKPISNAIEKMKTINGYEFDWNGLSNNNGHDVGVIAQEIEKVLPEVVITRDNGFKAVKYEKLTALLIQANKELIKLNEDLVLRIESLEKKLT